MNTSKIFLLVLSLFLYYLLIPKIMVNNFQYLFELISIMVFVLTFLKLNNMNKIFIAIFSIFIFLLNQAISLSANDDTYINSSNITYNEKENVIELAENSKINYKNTNILIDKGIIDYNNNNFEVFGNFYLYEDLTILRAKILKEILV